MLFSVWLCREIGALAVLFLAARYFEGAIPFPDVRTVVVSYEWSGQSVYMSTRVFWTLMKTIKYHLTVS